MVQTPQYIIIIDVHLFLPTWVYSQLLFILLHIFMSPLGIIFLLSQER